MKLSTEYGDYNLIAIKGKYGNGNLAVELIDEEEGPYTVLTVNLDDNLPEDHAYIDTNNFPEAEQFIKDNALGEFTGVVKQSGFCQYPLYRLNTEKMEEA